MVSDLQLTGGSLFGLGMPELIIILVIIVIISGRQAAGNRSIEGIKNFKNATGWRR
jgi:Sec-independent protein translocase protein TatA